jgi:hypothetical protein
MPLVSDKLSEAKQRLTNLGVDFSDGLGPLLDDSTPKLAKKWKDEIYSRIVTTLESEIDISHKISMLESGGAGAGAWLAFPQEPGQCFTDIEFKTASRLPMCLSIFSPAANGHQTCRHKATTRSSSGHCDAQLDDRGEHALLCKAGGHVVQRHNDIRDVLAAVLRKAEASTVLVEQNAPDTPIELLRPDIVFHDFRNRIKHIDVEVCTMHAHRVQGQHKAGALIEREEAVKRRKYRHLPLLPFVLSHLGRLGSSAQSTIKLVHRQADDVERSYAITRAYQSIACCLQKGNVALLDKAGSLI